MTQLIADLQSGVDKDGFGTAQLTAEDSLIGARLGVQGPGGISWFEGGSKHKNADERLAAYAAALGVAHIVQGHQHNVVHFPDGKHRRLGELYEWHGRLFILDVGMSQDIDESAGAVLHIQGNSTSVVCPNGQATRLWDDKRKPDSGKGVRCGS
jgi:hypothetical protein